MSRFILESVEPPRPTQPPQGVCARQYFILGCAGIPRASQVSAGSGRLRRPGAPGGRRDSQATKSPRGLYQGLPWGYMEYVILGVRGLLWPPRSPQGLGGRKFEGLGGILVKPSQSLLGLTRLTDAFHLHLGASGKCPTRPSQASEVHRAGIHPGTIGPLWAGGLS